MLAPTFGPTNSQGLRHAAWGCVHTVGTGMILLDLQELDINMSPHLSTHLWSQCSGSCQSSQLSQEVGLDHPLLTGRETEAQGGAAAAAWGPTGSQTRTPTQVQPTLSLGPIPRGPSHSLLCCPASVE